MVLFARKKYCTRKEFVITLSSAENHQSLVHRIKHVISRESSESRAQNKTCHQQRVIRVSCRNKYKNHHKLKMSCRTDKETIAVMIQSELTDKSNNIYASVSSKRTDILLLQDLSEFVIISERFLLLCRRLFRRIRSPCQHLQALCRRELPLQKILLF